MKKIKINTKKIKSLNACQDRLDNWIEHCGDFNGSVLEFLSLTKIAAQDKVWISVRVFPKNLLEVFAVDCAMRAVGYDDAADDAAYYYTPTAAAAVADAAATAAADAAYNIYGDKEIADAASIAEREMQVDSLIYLIERNIKND